MPFCTKCGSPAPENSNFCVRCGTPITHVPQSAPTSQPAQPVFCNKNFSAITIRYRCANGHVFDGNEQMNFCPTCKAPLLKGGYIQLYRMGSFSGMAVGMAIYIDNVPYGHIANKQSLRISVPFGAHKIHVTHTTARACNDPIFNISPNAPCVWCKAHFTNAGFAIAVDSVSPNDMPEI